MQSKERAQKPRQSLTRGVSTPCSCKNSVCGLGPVRGSPEGTLGRGQEFQGSRFAILQGKGTQMSPKVVQGGLGGAQGRAQSAQIRN